MSIHPGLRVLPGGATPGEEVPDTPEILNTVIALQLEQQQQQHRQGGGATTQAVPPANVDKSGCRTNPSDLASQLAKEELALRLRCSLKEEGKKKEEGRRGKKREADEVRIKKEDKAEGEKRAKMTTTTTTTEVADDERRLRRRARNKIAATKCREKKKLKAQMLTRDHEMLFLQNDRLRSEAARLTREEASLAQALAAHAPFCPCTQQPQPQPKPQPSPPRLMLNDLPMPAAEDRRRFDLLEHRQHVLVDLVAF